MAITSTPTSASSFVVLRGIEHGNRFWTTFIHGDDSTLLYDGTVAYEVIAYADTDVEAIRAYNQA